MNLLSHAVLSYQTGGLRSHLRAFQFRREVFRKPAREALKIILETTLRLTKSLRYKSEQKIQYQPS
jgi:hypothetical protein